jgi:hypothetical protein
LANFAVSNLPFNSVFLCGLSFFTGGERIFLVIFGEDFWEDFALDLEEEEEVLLRDFTDETGDDNVDIESDREPGVSIELLFVGDFTFIFANFSSNDPISEERNDFHVSSLC